MVIVVPAMGTTASFYQPFAEELAGLGFSVILPELPGTGASHPRPSWKVNYGYRDLVEGYLPGIASSAREIVPDKPVVVIGHSLGAHTGALAAAQGKLEVDALVMVAGGNIHFRNWSGAASAKVYGVAVLFPALTYIFGHLPGQHVGFGGPQARTLIRDWAKIIRTGRFDHIAGTLNPSLIPALSIAYEGDDFAPVESVRALSVLVGAEMQIVPVSWPGSPHSAWARNPQETVGLIDDWLVRSVL